MDFETFKGMFKNDEFQNSSIEKKRVMKKVMKKVEIKEDQNVNIKKAIESIEFDKWNPIDFNIRVTLRTLKKIIELKSVWNRITFEFDVFHVNYNLYILFMKDYKNNQTFVKKIEKENLKEEINKQILETCSLILK